jgi:hypothetical protein
MTVYVDDVKHRFRNMTMCHLWADTIDELHAFAMALGLKMEWFQAPPKASWEHYDISLGKKAQALKQGAVLTDKYGPVVHVCNLRLARLRKMARTEEVLKSISYNEEKLKTIAELRERKDKKEPANTRPQPTQGRLL